MSSDPKSPAATQKPNGEGAIVKVPAVWPAALSGLLIVACFPPFGLGLLAFIALVPWLIYLRGCDGKRAFRSGMLFGFIFWLGEFSFVARFVGHWTDSLALGFVPYLAGCFLGCYYFAFFGWLANICYRRSIPWMIPVGWAGVEVLRSYIFGLAFPFGLLAMPLTSMPALIQTAHYGTVYFTSAWVMLGNLLVAWCVPIRGGTSNQPNLPPTPNPRALLGYTLVFALLLGVSLVRYASPPRGDLENVVAGQPGIDVAFSDQRGIERRIAGAVDEISAKSEGADLLVLPEGIAHAGDGMPPPILFQVRPNLPVVFGGQRGEKPAFQSAFSYDGHWEFADKTRLVIFGEYVPFRNLLPDSFKLPAGDLTPGDKVTTLSCGGFKIGEALCFEALFPDVPYRHALNGANILAVMSIDDWYYGTNAPEQLRDASNWRAIETGLPVVRAASQGYSIIVDQRGRTIAQAPLSKTTALAAAVLVPSRPDLFPLIPVFPYLAFLSLFGIPALELWIRKKEASRHR